MRLLAACLLALVAFPTAAQPLGTISTVAGGGVGDGGPALSATIRGPLGVAMGPGGVIYVADTGQGRVRKIATDGTITTLYTGPQSQVNTYFPIYQWGPSSCPTDLAVDATGNLFFSDPCAHVVRRIDTAGAVSVVAGRGTHSTPFDPPLDEGPAIQASLVYPTHIALDAAGNLYITEPIRYRIRKVTTDGLIHHFTGATDSSTMNAQHGAIAVDSSGVLHAYISGPGTNAAYRIQRYSSSGVPTLLAGNGVDANSGDGGPSTAASISIVRGMSFDAAGNLVLAMADRLRHITPAGTIETVATVGGVDVAAGSGQHLVVSGDQVVHVTPPATMAAVAGLGAGVAPASGDGGPATAARLEEPRAVVADANGAIYIAETMLNRIRKVDAAGVITTYAGTGVAGYGGDGGPATVAQLNSPDDLAMDAAGNLYVADRLNNRVRRIDASGVITTFAGNGYMGSSGDHGPATAAQLFLPTSVAFDELGNLLIGESSKVRQVTPGGVITTLVGGGNQYPGTTPLPATSVSFGVNLVRAHEGSVYAVQSGGDSGAMIVRVNGSGQAWVVFQFEGYSESPGSSTTSVRSIRGLSGGPAGSLLASEPFARRILQRSAASGPFTVIAGSGTCGSSCGADGIGDGGPAKAAIVDAPWGIHFDARSGLAFFADAVHDRVRAIKLAEPSPAPFTIPAVEGAAISTPVTSDAVTPTGYRGDTSITIAGGGEYSVGCTGTFTAAPGTISPGQNVCVRQTSSSVHNATSRVVLTVGARPATFSVTTQNGPGSSSLSATLLDFGAQSINTSSYERTVTVQNTGANAITLNDVFATAGVSAEHDCGTSIAVAASCTVSIRFEPRAEGTVAGSVTLQLSSGSQTVALTGVGERSLATHYYRAILGREPEPTGKAFWNGEAARAASLGANPNEAWYAMAATFFASPEYLGFARTDEEFLADLYNTFFNRAPDSGGLAYWQGQLDAGLPREMLVTAFTFSPEFTGFTRAIFGSTDVRPEIDLVMDLYRGYLSRLPDDTGFAHWVGRLRAVQCGTANKIPAMRAEVEAMTRGFIESAEYAARARSDAGFLADTYAALFRRGADVPGFNYWKSQLASGSTRDSVRATMISFSSEFLYRISSAAGATCLS